MPTGHYERKPWGKRISFVCQWCNEGFELLESVAKQRKTIKYCSTKCSAMASRKPGSWIKVNCSQCDLELTRRRSSIGKKIYCSRKCLSLGYRVENAKWRNPDYIRSYMQEYNIRKRDRLNAMARAWNVRNRQKKANYLRIRRAKIKAGDFSAAEWDQMKRNCNFTCLACGSVEPDIRLVADHIVALLRGGAHTASNIQPLCIMCNARKGTNTTDYRQK